MKRTWIVLGLLILAAQTRATGTRPTLFDQQLQRIKYQAVTAPLGDQEFSSPADKAGAASSAVASGQAKAPKAKSPTKAMILSFVVPGAGQWYYGSKVKAVAFLGLDVTAWVLHFSYHNKGNQLTDQFNAFNDRHWSKTAYQTYLQQVYQESNDNNINVNTYPEISHHLPETKTQQYYEMTGKYNQFAWGWDDAIYTDPATQTPYKLADVPSNDQTWRISTRVPYSARRLQYEQMRLDANNKFTQARTMLMVAMANRLISGFEAFFMTRHHNNQVTGAGEELSRLDFQADLKSYYVKHDTPFLTASYHF